MLRFNGLLAATAEGRAMILSRGLIGRFGKHRTNVPREASEPPVLPVLGREESAASLWALLRSLIAHPLRPPAGSAYCRLCAS